MTTATTRNSSQQPDEMLEACMGCFALNNMGVTMLEKGYYREAAKTFKAAMLALRSLKPTKNVDEQQQAERAALLRDRLTKAASRAAKGKKKQKMAHRYTTTKKASSCYGGDIEIAAMDDNDREAMEAAQQYGPTLTIVFPIRLRELPSAVTLQEDGLDTHIAIIFYNAGIAQLLTYYYLLKKKKKNRDSPFQRERQEKALNKAYRLLSVADSAMNRSLRRQGGMESCRVISLASLVLANLSVTFRHQQNTDRVQQVEQTLHRLERKRMMLERHSLAVSRDQMAAAAA
mmetsp:Transcript_14870/g.28369  ORF Transcript_14870/g.28369 Transcript_14870/m.28369 type:complete len:288 (-) Transcript_14870:119-982(-)